VEDPPLTYLITDTVEFHETTGGSDEIVGSAALSYHGDGHWNVASVHLTGLTSGTHTYEARYPGSTTLASASAATEVLIGPQGSSTDLSLSVPTILDTQHGLAIVHVYTYDGYPAPTGTIELKTSPAGVTVGSATVTGAGEYQFLLPLYPVGTQKFVASYSGDGNFKPSSSPIQTLTIVSDMVDVSAVGLQYTTFYPIKDAYRDTVGVKGTRLESAGVSIRIYSPAGTKLKTVTIGKAAGAYNYAWNGRKSDGTVYASGKYKVVQVLTDLAGRTRTFTNYVNLSHKKLAMHTAYYTKTASQASKHTTSWIAWNFTLPSAAVYTGLRVYVYGRTGVPPGGFGAHDFTTCAVLAYHPTCSTRTGTLPYGTSWVSKSSSPSRDRHDRLVRVYAWASAYGSAAVGKAKIKVVYGILQ
jgi:hypothetical protein